MVEAAYRQGYAATTVRELSLLAGVSKQTVYEQFDGKEDLFLPTFDALLATASAQVTEAFEIPGDPRRRLTEAVRRTLELAKEHPAGAWLVAVESLALGRASLPRREAAARPFEAMIDASFELSPAALSVDPLLVRAIFSGIGGVIHRRLRHHRAAELPRLAESLAEWALGYQRQPGPVAVGALQAAAQVPRQRIEPQGVPWEEPLRGARAARELNARQRIVRAAAQLAVRDGFEKLNVKEIVSTAAVSRATFHTYFRSPGEAFLAAFQELADEALLVTANAFYAEGEDPGAAGAGLRALLEFTAAHQVFARVCFLEIPAAGPLALSQAERALARFAAFLRPPLAPAALTAAEPEVLEAIAGAVWATIQHEVGSGRAASLGQLAEDLTWIAVGPLTD